MYFPSFSSFFVEPPSRSSGRNYPSQRQTTVYFEPQYPSTEDDSYDDSDEDCYATLGSFYPTSFFGAQHRQQQQQQAKTSTKIHQKKMKNKKQAKAKAKAKANSNADAADNYQEKKQQEAPATTATQKIPIVENVPKVANERTQFQEESPSTFMEAVSSPELSQVDVLSCSNSSDETTIEELPCNYWEEIGVEANKNNLTESLIEEYYPPEYDERASKLAKVLKVSLKESLQLVFDHPEASIGKLIDIFLAKVQKTKKL